MILNN